MKTVLVCDLKGARPRDAVEAGLDFLRGVWPDSRVHCCYSHPDCTCRSCSVFPDDDQRLQHRFFGVATHAVVTHDDHRLFVTVHEPETGTVAKRLAALPCWSRTVASEVSNDE